MANIKSAKKRARQSQARRLQNAAQRSMFRTLVKNVVKAIDDNDKAKAEDAYKTMIPILDRVATKGLIHKNKAARHKSHLHKRIQAIA